MEDFDTLCVHPLGRNVHPSGSVASPIYPSAAYDYTGNEGLRYPGFYSTYNQLRTGEIIAKLEGGEWGVTLSSGMAAISTAILSFVQQGDHVIFAADLYGGTMALAEQEFPKRGIAFSYAGNTMESFRAALSGTTKLIYLETPANPLLGIVPLKQLAELARANGIMTIVDNTFASPINQHPIAHGIDIVVHSGTKFLGGHNDLPFGALVTAEMHREKILSTAKMYGGSLSAQACYLAERSLKTLALRVKKQNENAMYLADYLSGLAGIRSVFYPGLPSHPNHVIAKEQMSGFGGILSFEPDLNAGRLPIFLKNLSIIQPALSLGGVESLICAPAETSHRGLTSEKRRSLGINDHLLRLSVGIENASELASDLQHALAKAQ
ncbi:trans-sulfuration enzyme family protein [Parapedobacter indicus]|uniref:cysteine-S-conjugate beta-lyase n=1 Tax=Parapedobacter indicus TaxID=1477437 RepID=A0A1I3TYR2_9SPHI|nr:PLP-dependent aspartate aminotransferase family protein [Parapedobacter indicus]PPK99466.1 cystathionine beta-lyase [Parapedobacter indicus]SFJ75875.1 cystathionine beta-lyase [Parapedobacter indicus]